MLLMSEPANRFFFFMHLALNGGGRVMRCGPQTAPMAPWIPVLKVGIDEGMMAGGLISSHLL